MKRKVCEGVITSKFGNRIHPVTGQPSSFHNGVDIACPRNTPVYSPVRAKIEKVYMHELGGLTVVLRDLRNNDRYAFCHLNEACYNAGQTVAQGIQIAKSGNTGQSTGPHLHFSYASGGTWSGGICSGFTYSDPTNKIEFDD